MDQLNTAEKKKGIGHLLQFKWKSQANFEAPCTSEYPWPNHVSAAFARKLGTERRRRCRKSHCPGDPSDLRVLCTQSQSSNHPMAVIACAWQKKAWKTCQKPSNFVNPGAPWLVTGFEEISTGPKRNIKHLAIMVISKPPEGSLVFWQMYPHCQNQNQNPLVWYPPFFLHATMIVHTTK